MKRKYIFIYLIFIFFISNSLFAEPEAEPVHNPSARHASLQLYEKEFDFGTVVEGTLVNHDYNVKNLGNGTLYIHDVKLGCGCTTSEYPKEILPGNVGKINIQFNSSGYSDGILKKITVLTNDPENSEIELRLSGTVERFAYVFPEVLMLKGTEGETLQSSVTITPNDKFPFKITGVTAQHNTDNVTFSLEEKKKGYDLVVTNAVKKPGRYFEKITLKTDNPAKPEITIIVRGVITEKPS